jgi:ornithine cyclodeaminase
MLADIVDCYRCLIWGRDPEKVRAMIADLERRAGIRSWGLSLEAAESIEELASRSNLIVTATSAKAPVIPADAVRPGTHITAMGSDDDGKQELAAAILGAADVVVADSRSQCVHHGECGWAVREGLLTEGAIVELGEIITNPTLGRTSDHQVTVADLTGVAVQDVQIAAMVVRAMA